MVSIEDWKWVVRVGVSEVIVMMGVLMSSTAEGGGVPAAGVGTNVMCIVACPGACGDVLVRPRKIISVEIKLMYLLSPYFLFSVSIFFLFEPNWI